MNFKFKLSQRLARMKLAVLIAGTLALGCGVTSSGPTVSRIDRIDIAPGRLTLLPFQSADLTLIVTMSRGDSGALASLQWSTTGGMITNNQLIGGVRYITYSSPAQAGTYYLIVVSTTGWPADTASITVVTTPVSVNEVAVTPASANLVAGDTTRLRATLTDSTGSVIVGREITWSTSDAGVATVLASGAVRAIAAGSATITATCEGHTDTAVITVAPSP
jgi:hypothetical protein